MDSKYILVGIVVFISLLLVGSLYILFTRLKTTEKLNRELQKHVITQKQVLEQHASVLRILTQNQGIEINENDIPQPQPFLAQPEQTTEQVNASLETPRTNRGGSPVLQGIDKVLPIMTSLMGVFDAKNPLEMMQENEKNNNDDEVDEEAVKEKELQKQELVSELKDELTELESSIQEEGRIDDVVVEN